MGTVPTEIPQTAAMVIKYSEMPSSCPVCQKTVFAAEEKVAGGYKWHKSCFKCSVCNKRLDSTLCNENDGALFCKTCYGRKHGPKGKDVLPVIVMYIMLTRYFPRVRCGTNNVSSV